MALPALGHALAGSISTALSHLLTYPLDLVVTRLQVQQRRQGGGGEEEGGGQQQRADSDSDSGPRSRSKPGLTIKSGLANKEERGNTGGYRGVLDAARKIYRGEHEGSGTSGGDWRAFYSGVEYDVFKSMADAFLFFLAYTFLRGKMLSRLRKGGKTKTKTGSLSVPEELVVGMLAGAFGKAFTTPVQMIITRKQMMGVDAKSSKGFGISERGGVAGSEKVDGDNDNKPSTARAIARQIYRRKGLRGFWAGYTATLILTLNPSLTFLLHRVFSRLLLSRSRRIHAHPGSLVTFFLAALSKAVASTITYPFSLAKARLQAVDVDSDADAAVGFQDTIFHSVVRIVKRDGVGALYAGLEAEVLKGFLSHGNTMAIKERVHAMVVWLYLIAFRALKNGIGGDEFLDDNFQRTKIGSLKKSR